MEKKRTLDLEADVKSKQKDKDIRGRKNNYKKYMGKKKRGSRWRKNIRGEKNGRN